MEEQPGSGWLDRELYPFRSRFLEVEGGRLHFVDEGPPDARRTIVFVHGAPPWSFMYRRIVEALRSDTCFVAMDHLGFGLSDKPRAAASPRGHATNLHVLISALEVRDVTLVVHDFGGPIGLSWALDHVDIVSSLFVMNSWMWPFDEREARCQRLRAARLVRAALGSPARSQRSAADTGLGWSRPNPHQRRLLSIPNLLGRHPPRPLSPSRGSLRSRGRAGPSDRRAQSHSQQGRGGRDHRDASPVFIATH